MGATVYDSVHYPSAIYTQTHPDRLAVMATLYGIEAPPVERSRVLELGCGDGWNLIAMAYGLPGSSFTGIDLASWAIERGTAFAGELGLRNVSLRQMDVADAAEALGEFDYIIAHGLYSWVPEPVRVKIMELCGRHLAGNGVAYLSYNAYPGNHTRDLVRGMMRYHTAHFPEPEQKVRQARALVKLLAHSGEPRRTYHDILFDELERLESYTDAGVFHDDLSSVNQPFYFHEFMAHAAAHGLQYLAEADMPDNRARTYPPQVQAALASLDSADIVTREQYSDFLRGRAFRQTLLCRKGLPLRRDALAEGAMRLFVAGDIRAKTTKADPRSPTAETFCGPREMEIETDRSLVKAAFAHLGARWPEGIAFPDLLEHAMRETDSAGAEGKSGAAALLAAALVNAYEVGFVELRAHHPPLVTHCSAKPQSSPLARLQLRTGNRVASLLHTVLQIEDPLDCALLSLLDGSRDLPTLQADLAQVPTKGDAPITTESLEARLHTLARRALLVA